MKGLVLEPINMAGKGPLTTSPFSPPESPSGKFRAQRSVLVPQFHKKTFSLLIALRIDIKKYSSIMERAGEISLESLVFFPQVSGL